MSLATLKAIDTVRLEVNQKLDPERKSSLGQFMTPAVVADFMAALFSDRDKTDINLLDPGAGVGSLTDAFIQRWGGEGVNVHAYEMDGILIPYLRETLESHCSENFKYQILAKDFIEDAVNKIQFCDITGYTHAILNPPYKKINSSSPHRLLLRSVGVETVNLYTAFLALSIALMAPGGEIVAIIPRSFCNGLYYKPFREWMLERVSIEQIHLFHSRTSAFTDDEVLQENIILKLVRGKSQGQLKISVSSDASFGDIRSDLYEFTEIVRTGDVQKFIHIPISPKHSSLEDVPLATHTLKEIGLQVSTGPVVDFRLKNFLRMNADKGTVPLLYPGHFANGIMEWPKLFKKPNAIVFNAETEKWLYPSGYYTVVRRFSSKEERRRIVAHVVEPNGLKASAIGFENHLNVFHASKNPLSREVAHGLAAFLNSTAVDDYFRRFSGHTQVNATDLRLLRYPDQHILEELGQWACVQPSLTQNSIDQKVDELNGRTKTRRSLENPCLSRNAQGTAK